MANMQSILYAPFIAALTVMVSASESPAADVDGLFAVRGIGGQTCSTFATLLQEEDDAVRQRNILSYINWTTGYMSYVNRTTEGIFDVSPVVEGRDLLQIILEQCRQNEEALFENVTFNVLSALAKGAVISSSPLVLVEGNGQSRQYRKETIASIQSALVEKGFLEGNPDGIVGPATLAAVSSFQESQGLPTTGFLDFATVVRALLQ